MRYVGIDPGINGALAVIDYDGLLLELEDMPTTSMGKSKFPCANTLGQLLGHWHRDAGNAGEKILVVIEQQSPRPVQGVSSAFRMGVNYGVLVATAESAGIAWKTVTPAKWKRGMGLTQDKMASLHAARRLFPDASLARKKDNDRAEALLIAEYARTHKL